jgi:hypothetical protein
MVAFAGASFHCVGHYVWHDLTRVGGGGERDCHAHPPVIRELSCTAWPTKLHKPHTVLVWFARSIPLVCIASLYAALPLQIAPHHHPLHC